MGFLSSVTKPFKKVAKAVGGAFSSLSSGASSLLGSVIGAGGSILGAKMTADSVSSANDLSIEALKNRYQWTMEDMRKAGMNPIYAYQGAGTGTPSFNSAQYHNPLSGAVEGVNTAIAAKRADQERRTLKANEYNMTMSGDAKSSQDRLNNQSHRLLEKQFPYLVETVKANAESARSVADANKFSKMLTEFDASFWLRHPELREWRNKIEGFSPIIPKPGLKIK